MSVTDAQLVIVEQAYLEARDCQDRVTIGVARGEIRPEVRSRAVDAVAAAQRALSELPLDPGWPQDDQRAYQLMARWAADPTGGRNGVTIAVTAGESWEVTADRGFEALSARIEDEYARAQGTVDIGDVTITRLRVLERLGTEPNAVRRRQLFYALEPVWQTIDADGGVASPYQRMLPLSADRWARGDAPVDRNAAALGLATTDVETQLVAILETWRTRSAPRLSNRGTGGTSAALPRARCTPPRPSNASGTSATPTTRRSVPIHARSASASTCSPASTDRPSR